MKVAELSGAKLDCWVAKAEGLREPRVIGYCCFVTHYDESCNLDLEVGYLPSDHWSQGGPIIERESIATSNHRQGGMATHPEWSAKMLGSSRIHFGPTPLIAAMRCYVASKYGEEVPDSADHVHVTVD
jgi:hypothetical protein